MDNKFGYLQEKWMVAVAWLVLLVSLVAASLTALNAFAESGVNQLVLTLIQNPQALGSGGLQVYFMILPVLLLLGVGFLLATWLRFAHLTNEVIIALSSPRDDEEPIFSSFLQLTESSAKVQGEGDVYEAKGTLFGDVVRMMAFTWAVLLIVAPLIRLS